MPTGAQPLETVGLMLGMLASLAAVLLLAWFLLRWMGRRTALQSLSTDRKIQILDRVVISADKYLVLVRVAEKTVLVGMSTHAVQAVCEIEDPEGVLDLPAQEKENKFSAMLGDYMSRGVFRGKKGDAD